MLLEYNADVDLSVWHFVVVTHHHIHIVSSCQNPLYWAVEGGHVDSVAMLCEANADVNLQTDVCAA